jgi:hypothetical protein
MACDAPPTAADEGDAFARSAEAQDDLGQSNAGAEAGPQTMVIHSASLELVVDDPAGLASIVRELASARGGYVEESSSHGSEGIIESVDISLRVPAAALDDTLHELHEWGEVVDENIGGRDVTREHRDRQATIANKRAFEQRMIALLTEAASVEDALRIEAELERTRTAIDQLQSRIDATEHDVSMAQLEVRLRSSALPEGGSVVAVLADATDDASEAFITVVGGIIRTLGAMLPLALLTMLGFLGMRPITRRRRQRTMVARVATPPQAPAP